MEGDAGRGLEGQKILDGKGNDETSINQAQAIIPSCCLKARTSDPELEANCHATVVSGWFSEPRSFSGHYPFTSCLTYATRNMQNSPLPPKKRK